MFLNVKDKLDNPALKQILAASLYKPEAVNEKIEQYRDGALSLYGWVEHDEVVGLCGFSVHNDHVEILNIAVAEKERGRGIGRAMTISLRNKINLPIKAETDDDAVVFYRKSGFETAEFQKQGYRRWVCILK